MRIWPLSTPTSLPLLCTKSWKEAEQRLVSLPEDAPDCFEIFARFLYSMKLYICAESKDSKHDDEWCRLQHCWTLGDKLGSITFKDAISDAICDKIEATNCIPGPHREAFYTVSAFRVTTPFTCDCGLPMFKL